MVDNEPEYDVVVDITPPDILDGLALTKWQEIAPLLIATGVLTDADKQNLVGFCMAYKHMVEGYQDVEENGAVLTQPTGTVVKNPAFTAYMESANQMRQFSGLLGLDPASRTRINAGKKKENGNPFNNI